MDPRYLSQFATIVKFGSITRAAERLNLTQPTLSRTVQILEQRVGAPLLTRGRHGVRPTEIGQRLAETGQQILEQSCKSDEILNQWRSGLNREIRMGVGPLIALAALDGFMLEHLNHPKTLLHFTVATASTLLQGLRNGSLDLELAPVNLDVTQSELERELIFHDRVAIFAGRKNRFFGCGDTLSVEDLKHETWLSSGSSSGIFEPDFITHKISPAKMAFTGGIQLVLSLLKSSDVLVVLPQRLICLLDDFDHRHVLNFAAPLPCRDIAVWMKRSDRSRPDIMAMREQLISYFARLDGQTA